MSKFPHMDCRAPSVCTKEGVCVDYWLCGARSHQWSDETQKQFDAIDQNRRNAHLVASKLISD